MKEETQQAVLFFTLLIGIVLTLGALWVFNLFTTVAVLLLILAVLIVLYLQFPNYFTEVDEYERAVVFHRGKFKKVAGPGWLFVIPFLENFQVIDLREQTVDLLEQPVVTEDNIELEFDTVLYMKVKDAKKAVIEVKDFKKAAKTRAKARLRGIAGNMKMTEIVSNVDEINEKLQDYMKKVEGDWGVTFTNVELQSVDIPTDIQDAIQKRRSAEEVKKQKIEEAKGTKGEIDQIRAAADKLSPQALQYYYLQSLEKISEGKSSKIIFPLELSKLAGNLSNSLAGLNFGEAQDKIVDRYEELRKEGKDKESVINELKKEMEEGELKEKVKEEE